MIYGDVMQYAVAAAIGLGVELERDWTNRHSEQQAAGVRTFAVVALTGAVAADFSSVVLAASAIVVGLLLVVGYLRTGGDDRGLTTESAAFATFLLGALTHRDSGLAVGVAVVMASLLAAKGPIHRLSRQVISEVEVNDALRFLVVAFVVLPLVPDRDLGPYAALNPFTIWLLVVTLTGIGWVGYIAVRILGSERGLPITGLAGGFVSAAATTASLARTARANPSTSTPALVGALLASAATLIQLCLILTVANRHLLSRLLPGIGTGLVILLLEIGLILWRVRRAAPAATPGEQHGSDTSTKRPFALTPALILAATLTVVTLISRWSSSLAGGAGAIATAGVAGVADAHAPSLAVALLAANGSLSASVAVIATGCALAANTVAKSVLAFATGGANFGRRFAGAMAAPTAAVLGVLFTIAAT